MKKQIVTVFISIILLAGLLSVYYYTKNKKETEAAQATPPPKAEEIPPLIDKNKEDIVEVVFKSENNELIFTPKMNKSENDKTNWVLKGFEDLNLKTYDVDSMITPMYYLSVSEKLSDAGTLNEYGLEKPTVTATAKYTDGTTKTVNIGKETPAKDYYYINLQGENQVYLLNNITGRRFYNTLNDIIDKALPQITAEALTYVYIKEGNTEIEFDYKGSKDEMKKELESYGLVSLSMIKPYPGRDLYLSNFQDNILPNLASISIGDLIEVKPTDLSKYGLDDPKLTILLKDSANTLKLVVGNDIDSGNAYCMISDEPIVFSIPKENLGNFYNIDVFKFIDRFVALMSIEKVDEITISSTAKNRSHNILLNHEKIKAAKEGEKDEDILHPTVDGKKVQEAAFKTFYQSVIGLSYDTEIPLFTPTSAAIVTVTYKLNTNEDNIVTKYYEYNSDFYAVQRDNNPIQFVVNKQSVDSMFNTMDSLVEGKLDRE